MHENVMQNRYHKMKTINEITTRTYSVTVE